MQGQGKLLTWTWSDEFLLFLNVLRGLGQVQPFIVEECLGVFPWNALNWLQLREGQQHLFVLHSWELEIVGSRQTNGCCQALLEVEQRSESKSWISWLIIGAGYAGENVLWAVKRQREEEVVWWLGSRSSGRSSVCRVLDFALRLVSPRLGTGGLHLPDQGQC